LSAPHNAQATLERNAFLTLLLPMTVHGRVSDIWRSYIAQRVLRASGLRWGFHRADVVQDRNAHSLLGNFSVELPLYETASEFVRVVDEVLLAPGASMPAMLEQIYSALYELLGIDNVFALQHWVQATRALAAWKTVESRVSDSFSRSFRQHWRLVLKGKNKATVGL